MMVEDALKYPFHGDRTLDTFAVGGVLGLATLLLLRVAASLYPTWPTLVAVAFAAVPATALFGYLLRVGDATVRGDESVPGFGSPRELFGSGLRAWAVAAVYLGLPLLILLVTMQGVLGSGVGHDAGTAQRTALLVGSTVSLFLALAIAYVFPAALLNVARGGGPFASLDPRRVRPLLSSGAYFAAWMAAFVAGVLAWGRTLAALRSYSVVGVLAVFAAFYCHLVAARYVGLAYARAVGRAGGPL